VQDKEEIEIALLDIIAIDWWYNEELVTTVGILVEESVDSFTVASSLMRREPVHTGFVIDKGVIESIEVLANYEYDDKLQLH